MYQNYQVRLISSVNFESLEMKGFNPAVFRDSEFKNEKIFPLCP